MPRSTRSDPIGAPGSYNHTDQLLNRHFGTNHLGTSGSGNKLLHSLVLILAVLGLVPVLVSYLLKRGS